MTRLVRWLVGGRDAEAVAGDLCEMSGNRWWYWRQVLSLALIRFSPHRRLIPDLHMDFNCALRTMRRNPGYAAAAMVCLALGIGVNAVLFSLLNGLFYRQLPLPAAGRLVTITRAGRITCTRGDFQQMRGGLKSLAVTAFHPHLTYMDVDRINSEAAVEAVTANYSQVLQVGTLLGRWFEPGSDSAASEPVAVISAHVWDSRFHRDPAAIGKMIRVEGQWHRVVGVAPADFHGLRPPMLVDAWVPLATYRLAAAQNYPVFLMGRLGAGKTLRNASAEMAVVDARLRSENPRDPLYAVSMQVAPAEGFLQTSTRKAFVSSALLLGAITGVVLLIACVNIANLLLSRAAVRQREMAMRRALGATRGRLFRQALAEGMTLAAGGAILGVAIGNAVNRLIVWRMPSVPVAKLFGVPLEIDWRVAAGIAAVAMACAILFSLPPALENAGLRRRPRRGLYVLAQVALSLTLLIGSGLLLRALKHTAEIDPGFATDHRLYVRVFTPEVDFTPEQSSHIFTKLVDEARSLPGVREATLSFAMFGFSDSSCAATNQEGPMRSLGINVVEPNYFQVMGLPLLRGRGFELTDRPAAPEVMIVNEAMARQWWPGEDAMGKNVWVGCEPRGGRVAARVIGIARDSHYDSLDREPRPFYYVSRRQVWWNGYFALIVHTAGDPYALAPPLLKLAKDAGPNVRVSEVRSLDDEVALSLWQVKWQAAFVTGFGVLALLLAAVGLYGTMAYSVAQRTREIGVRMALGAAPADVQWMVLGQGLRITAIGVAAGLALSVVAVRMLRGYLYGLSPFDPGAFGGACLAWVGIAMLASWFPARRATRVDPLVALKWE